MNDRYAANAEQLFTTEGQRKYLTAGEARALLAQAAGADPSSRLFCELLYYTGCRISEGLALTLQRLDTETMRIVFRTLKRRKPVYRAVPVPGHFMRALLVHARALDPQARLFPWCRQTGYRRICALGHRLVMSQPYPD